MIIEHLRAGGNDRPLTHTLHENHHRVSVVEVIGSTSLKFGSKDWSMVHIELPFLSRLID